MASTADLIKSGAGSLAAGKDVSSDTIDSNNLGSGSSGVEVDEGQFVMAGESSVDDDFMNSGDTPEDSSDISEKASSDSKPQKTTLNKEVITVTDEKGRRKVEVDYSNKDAIKQAHVQAAGMRKFQAERDQALQNLKQERSQFQEVKSNMDILEKVYREGGVEGLVDLLEGQKGAYKTQLQRQIERHEFLKKATPDEVEALEAREMGQQQAKELEKIRKENAEFRKQMEAEKEAVEFKNIESKVHPVFNKYRFADKLGNPDSEQMFDEMLWNSALKRLEPYEEQGLDISPELLEREFRSVAQTLRKQIGLQAEKKASRVIEQKKQEATENAQAKVMSGYKSGKGAEEARGLIQSGNLTGLLKNWGKYGNLFNK